MNTLYQFNEHNLQYEALSESDIKAFHRRKRMASINAVCVALFLLAFCGVYIYSKADVAQTNLEMSELKLRHYAEMDSLQTEMNLERLIAHYAINSKSEKLTEETIWELLTLAGAWYPEIIVAQFKLESTSGTSDLAVNAHNLFGMKKVSGKRLTYTTQELHTDYKGYGVYKNWQLSVIDRIMYERFFFSHTKPTKENYNRLLSKYAEDEDYIGKLTVITKSNNQ